jgi:hypothetical protein
MSPCKDLKVVSWDFIAGPDAGDNMGQVVRISKPMPGHWQIETITRLTVSLGVIELHPN